MDEAMKELMTVFSGEPRKINILYRILIRTVARAKIRFSYKLWLFFDFLRTIIMVVTYYFFSFIVTPRHLIASGYTSDYFVFAAIGLALGAFTSLSLRGFAITVFFEQITGTIECAFVTPSGILPILIGDILFYILYASTHCVLVLGILVMMGKITFTVWTILSVILLVLGLFLGNLPLGIISAALILKYKQGDPISLILTWLNYFLSGVFYPISLIPESIRMLSYVFPLTWTLHGIRLAIMYQLPPWHSDVIITLGISFAYALIGIPLTYMFFMWIFNKVRKEGTLVHY